MPQVQIYKTEFQVHSKKGRALDPKPVTIAINGDTLEFIKSPFECKDEIKAMRGSHWCGYDDEPRSIWTVDNCFRNRFQIQYLEGKNPYAWFEREIVKQEYPPRLNHWDGKYYEMKQHQREDADACLSMHFQIIGDEPGLGKTLAAFYIMERSEQKYWWYVSRLKPCIATRLEFEKWGFDPSIKVEVMTYDEFKTRVDEFPADGEIPGGVIFDEASNLKNEAANRSQAAQWMADKIREKHGMKGYVILMTGSPSPKDPTDIWSLAEICFPGFLREGDSKSFQQRLAYLLKESFSSGGYHWKPMGWRDSADKCDVCGSLKKKHVDTADNPFGAHPWQQGRNEVEFLYERLKGLMIRHFKKDCLDLPEKVYKTIYCKPHPSTLRVAASLVKSSMSAVTGLTLLRELSDGFQYQEKIEGKTTCTCCHGKKTIKSWYDPADPDREYEALEMLEPEIVEKLVEHDVECRQCNGTGEMNKVVRIAREIACPKEDALIDILESYNEMGRIVVFAGFTGSVDRCTRICLNQGWHVVRCDGRGMEVLKKNSDGTIEKITDVEPLTYWANVQGNVRVAFVAHPESGGMGLNLTEASAVVFWSNSYKPEFRQQAEDRVHRIGADHNRGVTIYDLIHLSSDLKALKTIRANRRLERMLLGDVLTDDEVAVVYDEAQVEAALAA